jgi:tRNA-dihydrouridine synthase B
VRVARKHIQWYCQAHAGSDPGSHALWRAVNRVECARTQRSLVASFFRAGALPQAA